jgi:DNA recombination protein RmuC
MVESALPIVSLVLGAAIGALASVFVLRSKSQLGFQLAEQRSAELIASQAELRVAREARATFEERARLSEELRIKLETLQGEFGDLRDEKTRLETTFLEESKAFEEQKALLDEAQKKLADAFNALSSDALRKNNQAFLELARETLEGYNKEAKGELEKRQQAIDGLVSPLKDSLQKVDEHIKEMEKERTSAYAGLSEQVTSLVDTQRRLQSETSNLVKALRNPNQRGRWGEMQLKRVVEMAGMLAWCDFHEQQTTTNDGNILRPDVTVMLPNHKIIVVDSKTPLDAYLTATEATDDVARADALKAHSRQVREHIRQLSSKRYWDQFESTPELVVMFIPGEPVFGAALENDPSLIEYGVENKVLIATPVTLIGLLRSIAYGWRQESLEENAQKISQLGRDLYSRIAILTDHFAKVGKNLDRAVGSYNEAVGSLELRVLPQARKFKELQAATAEDIEIVEPLERTTRALQRPDGRPRTNTIEVADLFAASS